MSNYTHLIGAEEVAKAGHNMMAAAEEITRATNNLEDTLQRHQSFMGQWLVAFERIMKENKKP